MCSANTGSAKSLEKAYAFARKLLRLCVSQHEWDLMASTFSFVQFQRKSIPAVGQVLLMFRRSAFSFNCDLNGTTPGLCSAVGPKTKSVSQHALLKGPGQLQWSHRRSGRVNAL